MGSGLMEGFPFLARASAPTREVVATLPVRQAAPRTMVLRPGDPVEGVYLVTGGSLRVYYVTAHGREATLYWVRPGQTCVLALTAAFRRESYPAWVETGEERLRFVLLPGELFRQLFDTEPAFREFVFEVLSGRVFALMTALEDVASLRVDERLAGLLLRERDVDGTVRMNQSELAGHLGTAREVVSRTLRSMSARGLVATSRGRVDVLDSAGLRALAAGARR